MVKRRGPSKGADYLARERGMISPRFTTSCASLFAEDGNPWLSKRDQSNDFSASHSREAVVVSPEQAKRNAIYENARKKLEARGVDVPKAMPEVPKPSLHVDPEFDSYFAERSVPKKEHKDAPGQPVTRDHARWRANLLRRTRLAIAARVVDVPDTKKKSEKVFGNFYYFNAPEMTEAKRRKMFDKKRRGR